MQSVLLIKVVSTLNWNPVGVVKLAEATEWSALKIKVTLRSCPSQKLGNSTFTGLYNWRGLSK